MNEPLYSIPEDALTPTGSISFEWVAAHGLNALLLPSVRFNGKRGRDVVPNLESLPLGRQTALREVFRELSLKVALRVTSFLPVVESANLPAWIRYVMPTRTGTVVKYYAFLPWMAMTGIGVQQTHMWSEDPVIALAAAGEALRMLTFKHFGDPTRFQAFVNKTSRLPNAKRTHRHMAMMIEAQEARRLPVGVTYMSKAQTVDWDARVMSNVLSHPP